MKFLLMGMMMVQKMGGKTVKFFLDSKLVGQVRGDLEAWDPRMREYLSQVRCIQTKFEFFEDANRSEDGQVFEPSQLSMEYC